MKTEFENQMELFFDLEEDAPMYESKEEEYAQEVEGEIVETSSSLIKNETDYHYARANIKDSIDDILPALDKLSSIADISEQPRAYEVLSTLFKSVIEANKDLIELEKKHNEMQLLKSNNHNPNSPNVTNALFVGSTKELKELLDNRSND